MGEYEQFTAHDLDVGLETFELGQACGIVESFWIDYEDEWLLVVEEILKGDAVFAQQVAIDIGRDCVRVLQDEIG